MKSKKLLLTTCLISLIVFIAMFGLSGIALADNTVVNNTTVNTGSGSILNTNGLNGVMTNSLNSLINIVNSQALTPNIVEAWNSLSGLTGIISFILGVLVVGILIIFVIGFVLDILFILLKQFGWVTVEDTSRGFMHKMASRVGDTKGVGDYLKKHIVQDLILFALATMFISGQTLVILIKLINIFSFILNELLKAL